jgi:hypothetical protein
MMVEAMSNELKAMSVLGFTHCSEAFSRAYHAVVVRLAE